jgi:hypothetical protein
MHAVGLVWQSTKHAVSEHDDRNISGRKAALNLRRPVNRSLSPVVSTGLQNNGTRPLRYGLV